MFLLYESESKIDFYGSKYCNLREEGFSPFIRQQLIKFHFHKFQYLSNTILQLHICNTISQETFREWRHLSIKI